MNLQKLRFALLLLGAAPFLSTPRALAVDSILGRPVALDESGKILSWAAAQTASPYDHVIRLGWERFKQIPVQPNGLPTFYTFPRFVGKEDDAQPFLSGINWCHNPAGFNAMLADSALDYAAYAGDQALFDWIRAALDYQLAHGMTDGHDDWARVGYASSNPGETQFKGADDPIYCADGSACGRGDGPGIIEPDKAGELGLAYLRFYERTDDPRYLSAALSAADALARHVRVGDSSHSPWPFRVDAHTGRYIREQYSSNVLGPVALFDELLRIRGLLGLHRRRVGAYEHARKLAWVWLMRYPMQNMNWSGYFEDIPIYSDPAGNPNQITPLETARYLLNHPELDADWKSHVQAILTWVKTTFAVDVVSEGVPEAGMQWGAEVISEQREDMDKMASHTSRFASVLSLWYERTGDRPARDRAFRSFNWASYFIADNGVSKTSLDDATGYWFSDGYGDYMRHYLKGMASVPEWAPSNESHLLRSTSVIRAVAYSANEIHYETFDNAASEVLRVRDAITAVRSNGRELTLSLEWPRLSSESFAMRAISSGGFELKIRHSHGRKIQIDLSPAHDPNR